ncbi:MAG: type 4a pilus biogenesis protein PilO [Nitrospirae bacterium]|nr:type 4a pilus biogenesis protein PilO [Nitrospirota bacterium]
MTMSPIIRRYGAGGVLLLLAIAMNMVVYAGMLRPGQAMLTATEAQWRTERESISRYNTYRKAYLDMKTVMEKATARQDLPQVITTLASLAKGRGLTIPSVDYQPERIESKDFQKVGLTFALSGPYGQVRRFLDDLERSSPFFTIEGLTLTRAKKEESQLEVQLRVAAYLRVS